MVDVLIDLASLDTPSRKRGIGRYVSGLCQGLRELTTPLSLVGLTRHMGPVARALDPTLSYDGDPAITVSDRQYEGHKLRRRVALGSLVDASRARLAHFPDPYGTPLKMRTPRVVTCHDLIPLIFHRDYFGVPGARFMQLGRDLVRYRSAVRVCTNSAATKRDLIAHVGVPPDRIDVTLLGVNHAHFHPRPGDGERAKVSALLGVDGPFLLYLGAADARKHVPTLVRAYGRSRRSAEMPLVLAGSVSPRQREAIDRAARAEGVSDRVVVHGYVEEAMLPALYRSCFAHVFASAYEGFGFPVAEALACGAPTVTSRRSSIVEVAGDATRMTDEGVSPPKTPSVDAFAEAIADVIDDDALRARLREAGPKHAASFTWRRCAEQTLSSYERALAAL